MGRGVKHCFENEMNSNHGAVGFQRSRPRFECASGKAAGKRAAARATSNCRARLSNKVTNARFKADLGDIAMIELI